MIAIIITVTYTKYLLNNPMQFMFYSNLVALVVDRMISPTLYS